MFFTKEMLEKIDLPNLPCTNEIDATTLTQGKINKYLFEIIIEHFTRCNLIPYLIFIPSVRITDFTQWFPVNEDCYENCYEYGTDIKINTISTKDDIKLMIGKFDWSPKIILEPSLEGLEAGKIICHVLAMDDQNIDKYKKQPIKSYSNALQLFPDGLNWAHIRI